MLSKFWEKAGEGVANEWTLRYLTPTFAFWVGGILAWSSKNGWGQLTNFLNNVDIVTAGILLIVGAFFLVISGGLVEWMTLPVLRLFEGYWPKWFGGIRKSMVNQLNLIITKKESDWSGKFELYEKNVLDAQGEEAFINLDNELANYPTNMNSRMPTRLGNIIRAAEEYPYRRYGLEISTTWSRLWLCMSDVSREEFSKTRTELNWTTQLATLGILFSIWYFIFGVFAWWAIPISILVVVTSYLHMLSLANIYSQLLRAVYDLNRFTLYKETSIPLPLEPTSEVEMGKLLSNYLKRGVAPIDLPNSQGKLFFQHKREP